MSTPFFKLSSLDPTDFHTAIRDARALFNLARPLTSLCCSQVYIFVVRFGPITISELAALTHRDLGTISNHVRSLRDAGWVVKVRQGKNVRVAKSPFVDHVLASGSANESVFKNS